VGNGVDRRQRRRFDLEAKVQFNWKDPTGVNRLASGLTRDISSGGVFVYSNSLPEQDAVVQMKLALPSSTLAERGMRMRMKGRVLRLQPATPATGLGGFAATCRPLSLRRSRSTSKQIA
jgi:PilZ domain